MKRREPCLAGAETGSIPSSATGGFDKMNMPTAYHRASLTICFKIEKYLMA